MTERAAGASGVSERLRLVLWTTFMLLIAAAGVYLYAQWWRRGVPDHEYSARLCASNYSRAQSAPDSQIVDAQRPITSRGQATRALTCGEMRRTGMIR